MASATEMNTTTPDVTPGNFRMGMQGLLTAILYSVSFMSAHLAQGWPIFQAIPLAVFLAGLIIVPLAIGYPLALVANHMGAQAGSESSAAAFLPFMRFAIYGLAGILIWVATQEAHMQVFSQVFAAK